MTSRTIDITVYIFNVAVGNGSITDEYTDGNSEYMQTKQLTVYINDVQVGNGTYEDKITYNGGGSETKQIPVYINNTQVGYMEYNDQYGAVVTTTTTTGKKAGFPWIPVIILLTSAGVYVYLNKGE